jgi:hypothetical protein
MRWKIGGCKVIFGQIVEVFYLQYGLLLQIRCKTAHLPQSKMNFFSFSFPGGRRSVHKKEEIEDTRKNMHPHAVKLKVPAEI